MKKHIPIFNILLFIIILISCQKEKYHTESPTNYDKEILAAINLHRQSIGLKSLEHSDVIWQEANTHSENMANGVVAFGDEGLTARSDSILKKLGNGIVAENVAKGKGTAEEIVNSWLSSVGHKVNIEGNFTLTGISAIQTKDGTYYYTQIFYK
jgi:uncharacterized protein YkwD